MAQLALPLLATVFIWWFSTGLILYLDGLPRRSFRWTMLASTVLLGLALAGLAASRDDASVLGAYCAFTCAILVWGWQEVAFLLGYVTGPRRSPCPPGCSGWQRTRYAFQTVLHHELALIALALCVLAATWDGANQTGWWTYVVLWVMRQSAKLNVFLGVRNLGEGFLPPHLSYLQSYFRQRSMNTLFPVAVGVSTLVAVPLWQAALAPSASAFEATSLTLVATLLSLAIVEHWMMVLPLPPERLWQQWGLGSRRAAATAAEAPRVPPAILPPRPAE